jgi:hypothetical protein
MILFVIYKEPVGALWLSFHFNGLRAKYISKWHIVMEEDNQGEGAVDLGATLV